MQLTSTNRPFGLTIKFTRCRYSCQLSAFSPQLKTELRREQRFFSTARIWVEKIKHADNCAPTLLKFQDEADSAKLVQLRGRRKKQSRCTVAEIGKLTKKKVSHTNLFSCEALSSRSLRISNWQLAIGGSMPGAGGQFKFAAPILPGMARMSAPEKSS